MLYTEIWMHNLHGRQFPPLMVGHNLHAWFQINVLGWLVYQCSNLGTTTIFVAELWAIWTAMNVSGDKGIWKEASSWVGT